MEVERVTHLQVVDQDIDRAAGRRSEVQLLVAVDLVEVFVRLEATGRQGRGHRRAAHGRGGEVEVLTVVAPRGEGGAERSNREAADQFQRHALALRGLHELERLVEGVDGHRAKRRGKIRCSARHGVDLASADLLGQRDDDRWWSAGVWNMLGSSRLWPSGVRNIAMSLRRPARRCSHRARRSSNRSRCASKSSSVPEKWGCSSSPLGSAVSSRTPREFSSPRACADPGLSSRGPRYLPQR